MRVIVSLTLKSVSGLSIHRDFDRLVREPVERFLPPEGVLQKVLDAYQNAGLKLEAVTEAGCTFSATQTTFARLFGQEPKVSQVPYIRAFKRLVFGTDAPLEPPILGELIERVFFPKPSFELTTVTPAPPELNYDHVPVGDLLRRCNPGIATDRPLDGAGVQATVVDTGAYPHPYFASAGSDIEVVPAVSDFAAERDERGHGTGMTAVFLSQAPRTALRVVKMAGDHFSFALPAFQKAVAQPGRIISCSWGTIGFEPQLYLEIANAVRLGKIVVFSSGNGSVDSPKAFFSSISHPDVISVGGCYVGADGTLTLSNVSSSFTSKLFPDRTCPDILGPCGMKPFGQWILMPCEPGSIYDHDNGERDGTRQDDGWFVSSGTSAAAAYVSGLIALALQVRPDLSLPRVRDLLYANATPVTNGESNMKTAATDISPDLATGHGFVDYRFVEHVLTGTS